MARSMHFRRTLNRILPFIALVGIGASAKAQDSGTTLRLHSLAQSIASKQGDQTANLTEALKLCGFTIRKEDHTKISGPANPSIDLHLAITDYEIAGFLELYKRGQGTTFANFISGMDTWLKLGGVQDSVGPGLKSVLLFDSVARMEIYKPGDKREKHFFNQALGTFLTDLAMTHPNPMDSHYGNDAFIDPVQALIMIRITSEEIASAIKQTAPPSQRLLASLQPTFVDEAPGWAEDGFVGGITGLINKLVESKIGEKVSKPMDKVNAVSSISKFILTYTFLKNELKMEGDTNLLVRTKDTAAGEKKNITSRIYIDGTKVTDWLKENRKLIAMAGIDVDMPKSGGLGGIETSWEIQGDGKEYDFNNHKVQWASGQTDMSKIKTDSNGVAKAVLEGAPQRRTYDPKSVKAYEKSVSVKVTPQAKSTDMKQDVVDAITGAIGISGGPSGWIAPVMETLYRMKWFGSETINVRVRDWKAASSTAHVTVTVKGDGSYFSKYSNSIMHIDRVLDVTDLVMDIVDPSGGDNIPNIPDSVLKNLPEAQRKQIEEALKQQKALSGTRMFQPKGPGHVRYTVRDSGSFYQDNSDCLVDRVFFHSTDTGNLEFDYPGTTQEAKFFSLNIVKEKGDNNDGAFGVSAMLTATHTEERSGGKMEKPAQNLVSIFDNCNFNDGLASDKIKITLKPGVQLPGEEGTGFYGVTTIPFKFGPNSMFSGNITISISIQNKVPAK